MLRPSQCAGGSKTSPHRAEGQRTWVGVFTVDSLGYNPPDRLFLAGYLDILTTPTRIAQTSRAIRAAATTALTIGLVCCGVAAPRADTAAEPIRFTGEIYRGEDLSAIVAIGKFLVIGSDEGSRIQILEPAEDAGTYRPRAESIQFLRGEQEIDIEALAFADGVLYVLGSHSIKRKLIDPDREYLENRARLVTVSPEPLRKKLFRMAVDEETGSVASTIDVISLEAVLEKDPVLGPFTRIPAVENGVNIEGIAADGRMLYLGFRSPVLREGYVPVMRLRFDDPDDHELRFLHLDGAGVRSLARVADGFLVLASHERGTETASTIYHWNGLDQVPGNGKQQGRVERLLELDAPQGGTPEGLTIVAERDDYYEVIVVHDGIPGGHPMRLRVRRPH